MTASRDVIAETERVRKDGRRIWIAVSVSPVRDPTGALIGAAVGAILGFFLSDYHWWGLIRKR